MTEETFNNVQSYSPGVRLEGGWRFLLKEGGAISEGYRYVEVDTGKVRLRNANGHKINRIERDVLRK
jgi:hypothetical protein